MKWWHRRRDRRIAAHGGLTVTELGPLPEAERFVPTEIDRHAADEEITRLAGALADGVDEATGHSLDNLINSTAAQWEAEALAEYAAYGSRATAALAQAEAAVAQYSRVNLHDQGQVDDAATALAAARDRLAGRRAADRPQDAPGAGGSAEPPPWGGEGHDDAALLAGAPRTHRLHLLALVLAAGADLGAFFQVVERTLRTNVTTIWLVVLGFTATVLYLAHIAGVQIRDAKAGARWAHRGAAYACLLIWLTLGGVAFWVRLLLPTAGLDAFSLGSGAPAGGSDPVWQQNLPSATVFLALYVATGAVAAVGGYLTHNPLRDAYARARRNEQRDIERAAASAAQLARAEADRNLHVGELAAARQILLHELHLRRALAERLKQMSRVMIAQHAKDPAVTDAIFSPDQQPYDYRTSTPGDPS